MVTIMILQSNLHFSFAITVIGQETGDSIEKVFSRIVPEPKQNVIQ